MKVLASVRAALMLSHSMKRIADALEDQNRIRRTELMESGIVVPDPAKKWSKQERETEISYDSVPMGVESEDAESWDDVFRDR
jgi:hypothetical protein